MSYLENAENKAEESLRFKDVPIEPYVYHRLSQRAKATGEPAAVKKEIHPDRWCRVESFFSLHD